MTLIVAFLADDFAVLVSDRRITWQIGGANRAWEDTENKAVVLCGHLLVGYTGFARLEDKRTDEWLVSTLVHVPPHKYLGTVAAQTERVISSMGLPLERTGHTFAAVGFLPRNSQEPELVPCIYEITNALTKTYGEWKPRSSFEVRKAELGGQPFLLGTYPNQSKALVQRYVNLVHRYRKGRPGRILGVAQLMVAMVGEVAKVDSGVSSDVSIAVLPRSAVPVGHITAGAISEPVTDLRCCSLTTDSSLDYQAIYAPAMVCPGMAMMGMEARFGSTEPIGPRGDAGPPAHLTRGRR